MENKPEHFIIELPDAVFAGDRETIAGCIKEWVEQKEWIARLDEAKKIIDIVKITEVPTDDSFGNLARGQIFVVGQMNILFRLNEYLSKLRKKAKGER